MFIIPKKEYNESFINEYHGLNKQLVRKVYNFFIIGETILKLEGLHYATEFYPNMGYYTIDIFPKENTQ